MTARAKWSKTRPAIKFTASSEANRNTLKASSAQRCDFGGPDEGDWVEMKEAVAIDSVDFSFGCWMKPDMSQIWLLDHVLSGRDRDHVDSGFFI